MTTKLAFAAQNCRDHFGAYTAKYPPAWSNDRAQYVILPISEPAPIWLNQCHPKTKCELALAKLDPPFSASEVLDEREPANNLSVNPDQGISLRLSALIRKLVQASNLVCHCTDRKTATAEQAQRFMPISVRYQRQIRAEVPTTAPSSTV
jgi:hypothetical protein